MNLNITTLKINWKTDTFKRVSSRVTSVNSCRLVWLQQGQTWSQSGDWLTGNCYWNVGLVFVVVVSLFSQPYSMFEYLGVCFQPFLKVSSSWKDVGRYQANRKRLSVGLRFFCIFEYKSKGTFGRPKVTNACPGFGSNHRLLWFWMYCIWQHSLSLTYHSDWFGLWLRHTSKVWRFVCNFMFIL